jgi:hypothetical protein
MLASNRSNFAVQIVVPRYESCACAPSDPTYLRPTPATPHSGDHIPAPVNGKTLRIHRFAWLGPS